MMCVMWCDSGAGYKYTDLLTYLFFTFLVNVIGGVVWEGPGNVMEEKRKAINDVGIDHNFRKEWTIPKLSFFPFDSLCFM